jgi:hypothetical protein
MKTGTSTEFTTQPVVVSGIFEIQEQQSPIDGTVWCVYHIRDASVDVFQ